MTRTGGEGPPVVGPWKRYTPDPIARWSGVGEPREAPMKVVCDRGSLLDAINLISGVVAARTPKPQLGCVQVRVSKQGGAGSMTLIATDTELSLRLTTDRVDVARSGDALVPADKLRQIVSAEENESTLTLESEKDSFHIRGEDAHFQLLGYPPAEFPPIPGFPGPADRPRAVITQPAGVLAGMISRTAFATARENSRYAINGVLLKRDGKRLEMVATDGRRLALCRITAGGGEKDAPAVSCIVPTKALSMLQRLLDDAEEPVTIAIAENQVFFAIGSAESPGEARAVLSTTVVEGAFPPYEEVIPKDQDKKVTIDRDLLSSAVKRAALLTNEESRGVRMHFNGSERQLQISSRAPEMGEATVKASLLEYSGDDLEIGFNPTFITDALKVMSDPKVVIEMKAPNKPGVIKSGGDFTYVVMPVNLQ